MFCRGKAVRTSGQTPREYLPGASIVKPNALDHLVKNWVVEILFGLRCYRQKVTDRAVWTTNRDQPIEFHTTNRRRVAQFHLDGGQTSYFPLDASQAMKIRFVRFNSSINWSIASEIVDSAVTPPAGISAPEFRGRGSNISARSPYARVASTFPSSGDKLVVSPVFAMIQLFGYRNSKSGPRKSMNRKLGRSFFCATAGVNESRIAAKYHQCSVPNRHSDLLEREAAY